MILTPVWARSQASLGLGFPVGQQIDGLVAFEIHQDRAEDLAAPKRKIVHA
jgi:hypothetical protein